MIRARSEPPASQDSGSQQSDRVDGMMMSKVYSDESLDVKVISSTRPESFPKEHKKSLDDSSSSLTSVVIFLFFPYANKIFSLGLICFHFNFHLFFSHYINFFKISV